MIETTSDSLYAELLMLEGVEDRLILILEGESDVRFFRPFVNEQKCAMIPAGGRPVALGAAALADENQKNGVLAFVDADNATLVSDPRLDLANVIVTDLNDIDAELVFSTSTPERVVDTHTNSGGIRTRPGCLRVADKVEELLNPITTVAFHCRNSGVMFRSKNYPVRAPYWHQDDLHLDMTKFIEICCSQSEDSELVRDRIDDWLASGIESDESIRRLHNGHHAVAIMHLIMKKWGGYSKSEDNLLWAMRAALHFTEFISLACIKRMATWVDENWEPIWKAEFMRDSEGAA